MHTLPEHPGKRIARDCLSANGLTITQAAERLGVARNTLSRLINGRHGVSADMAIRLASEFGGEAETWLKLQMDYDLAVVRADIAESIDRRRPAGSDIPSGKLQPVSLDGEYLSMTPSERLATVWPLTMTALAFDRKLDVQSRLSRDTVALLRREGGVPVGWRVRPRGSQ